VNLLTYSITIYGISAPWFSWVAAGGLILWPAWAIIRLLFISIVQKSTANKLLTKIDELQKQFPVQGSKGVSSSAIGQLHKIFSEFPTMMDAWNTFKTKLIYKPLSSDSDNEQVWTTERAASIFKEDLLLGHNFNKRYYDSIPVMVTSIGLLMTFAAILVGLLDVKIEQDKVKGLQSLIGGLSGKFISSVAALLSATVFLFLEKSCFHRLDVLRLSIATAIDSLIPNRTEAHLLEEICENLSEQTTAFRTFNSDLSLKLRNSFSESMGPALERMAETINELNQLIRSAQAELLESIREMNKLLQRSEDKRQESISGQLETLLQQLHQSLEATINNMSKEFNKSLTGSTQEQFGRMAETVGATAEVLGGMNKQFSDTQVALQELITLSKQSTENQLSNGSALIEKMVTVLGGTLVQMQANITEMSSKMTSTIEGTAERSSAAAGEIISEVKNMNEKSVLKLLDVLNKHEEQIDKVVLLKQTLQDAVEEFGEYVTGYNKINSDLKKTSQEANTAMSVLSQSVLKLKEGQESFNKIADFAKVQIQTLSLSQERQQDLWKGINTSMEKYNKTFQSIESSAANILSQLSKNLQDFSRVTQEHFSKTVKVADDHVNLAVGKLNTSIEELSEKLDDLSETVEAIGKMFDKIRR
jgi:DNA-directed RNA polymerase subunit F